MAIFKTRARTLDLLGRQQIAGIPTAINELIKNAHDAYANNFAIDFIRKRKLLILRDDGLGMSKEVFENCWLTLGTESKCANAGVASPPRDPNKEARPILGEKGIGRLAIAAIGPQVLVVTKDKLDPASKIVVGFVNWELFELPGINLEDIFVPVEEYDHIPNAEDLRHIVYKSKDVVSKLYDEGKLLLDDKNRVSATLDMFDPSVCELLESLPGRFPLDSQSGGTFFFISPTDETLISDIEGDKDFEATKMQKMLMGFHNTMLPGHPEPSLNIDFRDYRDDDCSYQNIIDPEHFFTPEDFETADHHFIGEFDSYGQFNGNITIYGEKTFNHTIVWRGNNFRETLCGPFSLNLAYLQGTQKSSRVNSEDYQRIKAKGDKFGGLYIYRNNIRILPYGNSDYDFLDIEKNRSKRAATYFFSYRRMFGAIEIADRGKSNLVEKAGREGFIENKAYRQLRSILKNFFVQLAADFFGTDSLQSEYYNQKKEEYNKFRKALEAREKLKAKKKSEFARSLDNFFEKLTDRIFEKDVSSMLSGFENEIRSISLAADPDAISQNIIEAENSVYCKINKYKQKISVPPPCGFALTEDLRRDYGTYLDEFSALERNLFASAWDKIDELVTHATDDLKIEISKRRRLEKAVIRISKDAVALNTTKQQETTKLVDEISNRIKFVTSDLLEELGKQVEKVKSGFLQLSLETEDFDLVEERKKMENEIETVSVRNTIVMDRIIRQLESFYIERAEDGEYITNDQIADATSERLDDLQNNLQADLELSQLGLAVGILHHEFNSTVNSIRQSIKDLRAWSDVDKKVESIYKNIKVNFEHLDGYLNLFTPLNRRLNRRREEISLMDIKHFLLDLFQNRLERHSVSLKHTYGFEKYTLNGFRSTFYPVFVNIVDNAIYWMSQNESNNRTVRLHADSEGVYISNNGPTISVQDSQRIFDLRFTRKPYGRGLGLSISRDVLRDEGYELGLVPSKGDMTVTFKISKTESKSGR